MGTVEAGREEEVLRATLRGESSTVMGLRLATVMGLRLAMLMGWVAILMGTLGILPTMLAASLAVSGVSARMLRRRS
jgi:hypothetical protein